MNYTFKYTSNMTFYFSGDMIFCVFQMKYMYRLLTLRMYVALVTINKILYLLIYHHKTTFNNTLWQW